MGTPRVLVTGCAGYIGTILTQLLLEKGCHVIGVDNFIHNNACGVSGNLGHSNFEFHHGDVRNNELMICLMERADTIVPLAAMVGAPVCDKWPDYTVNVNSDCIRMMMHWVRPYQRIIFTNTNSGYGTTDGDHYCTEDEPLNPCSLYGRTKCEAEKFVLKHPNSVSLRLATVFGASPRMRFDLMVNDFTEKIRVNKKMEIYEPHFKRNFVHVRDVTRAIYFMVGRPSLRGVFNVGLPDANISKIELAHKICDELSISRECIGIGTGIDADRRNYLVSSAKLMETGFRFEKSLEAGIREVRQMVDVTTPAERLKMRNA